MFSFGKTVLVTLALALAVATPAGAHGGAANAPVTGGTAVKLRDCHLTAAFVPRPASALDFGAPFYGPDPLVGIWAMACDRSRVADEPAGQLVLSLVGVPVGLTAPGAIPLANNFAHRLLQLDTTSRALAKAARRAGLPATIVPAARYRHSPPSALPSRGRLVVPGSHTMAVGASQPDPTNPHDHANLFEHRGRAALALRIEDAFDRFCLSPGETCTASLQTGRNSALRRLLGRRSAPVRAAFDHDRIGRVDIVLSRAAAAPLAEARSLSDAEAENAARFAVAPEGVVDVRCFRAHTRRGKPEKRRALCLVGRPGPDGLVCDSVVEVKVPRDEDGALRTRVVRLNVCMPPHDRKGH